MPNPKATVIVAPGASHPGIRPDSRLTAELAQQYADSGNWTATTLRSLLTAAAAERPNAVAAVDRSSALDGPVALTYAEFDERAHRFACGLRDLGVRAGDSVTVMLPNQIDFAALIFAIAEVGAVYTGIPVTYGKRDIEVILRRTGARVIVVAERFGGSSPLSLIRSLRPALATLEHVVVAGPGANTAAGERLMTDLLQAPEAEFDAVDARTLCHVGFTSGTTGEPKGVMNTHQTLTAVLRNWVVQQGRDSVGDPLVNLVASPVGHHTGFLWGVLLTTFLRGRAVYLDRWNPAHAADVVRDEGVTTMFGAPTFLQDLLLTDLAHDPRCTLRTVVVAGSPVPRSLPAVAGEALGAYICPAWGMTELGIGISCARSLPPEAQMTDGVPVPGTEVRIVDGEGMPSTAGQTGSLQVRGPGLFLGYLQRPDATSQGNGPDGWFSTGDTARMTEEGYVVLQGRTKDIIIRGGENIPVVAVESLLFQHPDVLEVSVVGLPDARLGERACAVVVPRDDAKPTLEQICDFLLQEGLSKHFLPERLELVPNLPKTPSGKIRKVELRQKYGS